jgi:hypothetical protein
MELLFEKTCDSCPEQYEVFDGHKMVGYIRLRHGHLYVACPDVGGEIVYEATIGDGQWDGQFETEAERAFHLDEASIAIEKWLEKQSEQDR